MLGASQTERQKLRQLFRPGNEGTGTLAGAVEEVVLAGTAMEVSRHRIDLLLIGDNRFDLATSR
ncbi:protein of unknown function (plasmid) [Shinella sp. WSC3-e]|nr:protein of unknown function [Shinella sp. WSC3-e]